MSKLPYWRWWRYVKRRRATAPGTRPAKPWNGLVVLSGLIALDQAAKHLLTTPDWAWHVQPDGWLIYPVIGCAIAALLMLLESTRLAGVLLMAGAVGNGSSEALYNRVANPFVTQNESFHVAFNVADVYLMAALVVAAYVTAAFLVTHRPRRQPA